MFRPAIVVGSGAALGALARLGATALFDAPWALLGINVLGCLLMGALRPGLFWGKGVLGGFTSFSAFCLVLVQASPLFSACYLAATLIGCLGAWLLGDAWAQTRRSQPC
ncbi:fluoride efflux transporter family protein [Corynebacterium lowii]|uniref:Fluoride-specific ion channel FluC n=1 Tax=Corynebacterium lowii TaxID=1544413 RepID=A0A0Q0Z5S9_9CORY|nr:fluoride efflux transporter family protein [Corynebacterium lowii]KQB84869.1 putative fluoride ion transporter CrcB [Corynebacterium lowii]MDP9851773.1 CrcB protein [Corynebacterium lowii]